jgi:hypothetical protein
VKMKKADDGVDLAKSAQGDALLTRYKSENVTNSFT